MFHRIMEKGKRYFIPPMALSSDTFERLAASLCRFYRIVSLDAAAQEIAAGTFRGRAAAFTFDDGYQDNYTTARPILLRLGIPAVFFVPVQQIDSETPYWWDRLYGIVKKDRAGLIHWLKEHRLKEHRLKQDRLKQDAISLHCPEIGFDLPDGPFCRSIVGCLNSFDNGSRLRLLSDLFQAFGPHEGESLVMNWAQIRQMQGEGFSIGSHTRSHIPLTDLTQAEARQEIIGSRALLEKKAGGPVNGFSYPRGAWNPIHAKMAAQAGYRYAVTTKFAGNRNGDDPFALSRRNMEDFEGIRSCFPLSMHLLEISGLLDQVLTARR